MNGVVSEASQQAMATPVSVPLTFSNSSLHLFITNASLPLHISFWLHCTIHSYSYFCVGQKAMKGLLRMHQLPSSSHVLCLSDNFYRVIDAQMINRRGKQPTNTGNEALQLTSAFLFPLPGIIFFVMAASSHLELVQALQLACSQNPDELKLGEKKLEAWKTEGGYYSGLAVSDIHDATSAYKCSGWCDDSYPTMK